MTKGQLYGSREKEILEFVKERKNNAEIDAWPVFDGAKQEIECVWEKVKMQ